MLDKMKEECGLFGVYGHPEAAMITYLGLFSLQHRGQESTGIVSTDGKVFHQEKGMGLVNNFYNKEILSRLKGHNAIGHNRYSTAGESDIKNAQPLMVTYSLGKLALAHNGNLINSNKLRKDLESFGAIFQTTTDSEVIIHLIAHSKEGSIIPRVIDATKKIRGAFCLLFLSEEGLIGVRDPYGLRPLSIGKLKDSWILASETCAFDVVEAEFVRDVEPGEMVVINDNGIESFKPFAEVKRSQCVFEFIYFSRPDSYVFGHNVYSIRKNLGRQLAIEQPSTSEIVMPVPDSGIESALGYSQESGLSFETGLIRSHYVGRTFIQPSESMRNFGVRIKLNVVRDIVKNKGVVIIDDSIVRGTTSRKIIKMVRDAGAKKVDIRISSPPILYPCYYGIDTPTTKELIASASSVEEVCKFITADSLGYISIDGMLKAIPCSENKFCTACFTGEYPIANSDKQ